MEKAKKPIYKKVWFWVIVIIGIIIIASSSSKDNTEEQKYNKNEDVKVAVVDFSGMTRDEIISWGDSNKVNISIEENYSDSISKGSFVSQSINANTEVCEGEKIKIIYSLGKEPTMEYKNALKKAESYSNMMYMSKQSIYEQLTSEYGEKFPADAAQYAIDNMNADWKENALKKAKSYQETMSMSTSAIYDQLISEYGEKFTKEEAQYAIDNLNK